MPLTDSSGLIALPLHVVTALCHAHAAWLGSQAGIDLLHLKGDAIPAELRHPYRSGTDADVLVRHSQVNHFQRLLRHHDWQLETDFHNNSSFEHAAIWRHPVWGMLDVHRMWPGLGGRPEDAFDLLWATRETQAIGGVRCAVPSVDAHAVILLLHAARSGHESVTDHPDVRHVWGAASDERRAAIRAEAVRLEARLGLSVITGNLDDFDGHREYRLWKVAAHGGTRREEWHARLLAARGLHRKVWVLLRGPAVNVQAMAVRLGRPPTRSEVVGEFFARVRRLAVELLARRGHS